MCSHLRRNLAVLAVFVIAPLATTPAALAGGDGTSSGSNGPLYAYTQAEDVVVIAPDGTISPAEGLPELFTSQFESLEVSPDGTRLLYPGPTAEISGQEDERAIYLASPAGGDPRPIIDFGPASGQFPSTVGAIAAAPDGTRFAFSFGGEVHVGDMNGMVRNLEVEAGRQLAWAGDGRLLKTGEEEVDSGDPDLGTIRQGVLFEIDPDTGAQTRIGQAEEDYLAVSPDGSQAVYPCTGSPDEATFVEQLCLRSTLDGSFIAALDPVVGGQEDNPIWSPDGQRIAFIHLDTGAVHTTTLDGSDVQQLTTEQDNIDRIGPWSVQPTTPPTAIGPPPANNTLACGGFDGDAATTERADYADPALYAVAVSQARFGCDGSELARHVVLSRDDAFADSLVGAALTGEGPLLFTATDTLPDATTTEITRVIPPDGTVYLLGGTAAISQAVEDELTAAGFTVQRLAGPSRVETSVEVARQVQSLYGPAVTSAANGGTVAIARAGGPADNPTAGWADSVTAGAWTAANRVPTVVTDTASLHPAVAELFDTMEPATTVLLGGTAALSQAVEDAVPGPQRIAGASRADTARLIAIELIGEPDDGTREAVAVNGFRGDGWLFGLPAAGLAADTQGAIALVTDPLPPETGQQLCSPDDVDVLLAGGLGIITDTTAAAIDAAPAC